jgi:hypothetical protein
MSDTNGRASLKPDRDVRGVIALISIVGSLAILAALIMRGEIDGPIALAFLGTLSGPVLGFYYGGKGGGATSDVIAGQSNAAAAQREQSERIDVIHDLVNAPFEALKSDIARLNDLVATQDARLASLGETVTNGGRKPKTKP